MKIIEYVFRKRDGSIRTLKGTRDFGAYAETNPETWEQIKPKGIRTHNPHNITLIDIENGGWRSIKPETIIARREVKPFQPTVHIHDYEHMKMSDIAKLSGKKSCIKRNKIPYYALMILGSAPKIKRNDLEVIVESIQEKLGRKLTVRNGHIRAFTRAFHKFVNNGLVEKLPLKGDYYTITPKGADFLQSAVN